MKLWTRGEVIDRMAQMRAAKAPITVQLWDRKEASVFHRLLVLHAEIAAEEENARICERQWNAGGSAAFWFGALLVLHCSKGRRLQERRQAVIAGFDGPDPVLVTTGVVATA